MGRTTTKTMTKRELAYTLAARMGVGYNFSHRIINEAIAEMMAHLSTPGNRIEFRGFVSVESRMSTERLARNPRKPAEVHRIGPRFRLRCIASPKFNKHTSTHTMPCPSGVGGKPGQ